MLNNSATTTATVITLADLAVSKAYTLTGFAGAGTITYTITITNNGPSDAQSVSMVDALDPTTTQISATPSGGGTCGGNPTVTCSWTTVGAGQTRTVTIVASLNPDALNLCNTATVSSTTTDPNPANNTSTICLLVPTRADIKVVKKGQLVGSGRNIRYTIQVFNFGPSVARSVTLADPLDANTSFLNVSTTVGTCTGNGVVICSFGDLWPGPTPLVVTILVKIVNATPAVYNTVKVNTTTADPDLTNNKSSVSVPLGGAAGALRGPQR
jgi:uncharacterized repeat protein (TIGR01451 family)